MGRTNKGAAWAWLKSQLVARLGADEAQGVLSGYYEYLNAEYRDRRRVAAAAEIEQLQAKLNDAALAGRAVEVRKLERMINHRKSLVV